MTKDEALDMALEFVEANHSGGPDAFELITAIKQARALDKMADNARELGLDYEPVDGTHVSKVWWDGEKLMAKPIPFVEFYRPVQQKPSCKDCRTESPCRAKGQDLDVCSVYVPPPAAQRQWVGLTDEEWQDFSDRYGMILFGRFKNEIETKLREKNTP
jgi:hypothetical protein